MIFLTISILLIASVLSYTISVWYKRRNKRTRHFKNLGESTNPLRSFATAYLMDSAMQGISFLMALATFVAAFVAYLTHRSKSTTVTAIMALASLLSSALTMINASVTDVQKTAEMLLSEYIGTAMPEADNQVYESIGQLSMTIAVALAGAYGTKKSMAEILAGWPSRLGQAKSSTKAIWDSIKEVWYAFHPNMTETHNLDRVSTNVKKLRELAGLASREFITRESQMEIKNLVAETDEICKSLPRSDAADHLKKTFMAEHARIVTRQTEQRAVIDLSCNVRRLPVFISIRGPPGHGKSYTLGKLHKDMSAWMMEQGHLKRPMDRLIGTGGGDAYLPPIGNQEWYVVDEYLSTFDDVWIPVINKVISDNPVTLSGAFVKNAEPHPHFVVTTSNIELPFDIPQSSKNYMRPQVLEAFHSRHQWIHYSKPNFNKSLGRNSARNARADVEMRLERIVDNRVQSEAITYDDLLDLMKTQWTENNDKYQRALAEIIVDDIGTNVEVETNSQPTVLGLYGASGMGKTTHINENILPILETTREVHHVTNLNMWPLQGAHVYVIDDMLTTDKKNLEKYRKFYERCSGDDVIVIADNLMFPRGHFEKYFPAVIEYLAGCWFKTKQFSWANLWEPRRILYDVSKLEHESLVRRLGFSEAIFKGRLVSTATGGNNTAWIAQLGGFFESRAMTIATDINIMEVAAECLRGSYKNLTRIDYLDYDGPWDIDVKLNSPEDIYAVLARPTETTYVRVKAALIAAFPDYKTLVGSVTSTLDRDAIFDTLARAYRRKAYTARLIVGDRSIRVANGKVSGLGMNDTVNVSFEETEAGALVRWSGGSFVIPWVDFFSKKPTLPAMDVKQIRSMALARRQFEEMPKVMERQIQFKIDQRRAQITMGLASGWQTMLTQLQENKSLVFVISALTLAVGTGGAVWLYLNSVKRDEDDEDDIGRRLRGVTDVALESYEQTDKARKVAQIVQRRKIAKLNANPESYEEKDKAAHYAARVIRQKAAAKVTQGIPEFVDLTDKPTALNQHITTAVNKVTENSVWLINGQVACYGIAYKDRRIICPHHILMGKEKETTVEFILGENKKCTYMARTVAEYLSRDIAILEITDKTCPSFKDIRKFFAKEKELLNHHTAFHFLPKNRQLVAKNIMFQYRLKSAIKDVRGSAWAPQDRIYFAESWTTPKLTVPGDCGTALIAHDPKYENRNIIGIHIAAKTAHESYVASICQEDFDLTRELATPESEEIPLITIHGHSFVEPKRPICNWNNLEDGGYTTIEDSDRLKFVGYSQQLFSPSWTRGGDLRPSPISARLEMENDQGPAPVSNRDPRIDPEALAEMPRGRDGQPSLGAAQLKHISGKHTKLDPELKRKATETLVDMWMRIPGIRDWAPLTPEETLNGVHEGKYAGYMGPIRGDTSPGLPWKKRGCHKKSSLLVSRNEPGQPIRWDWSDKGAGKEMLECYHETLDSWKNGYQYQRIIDCNLKVECLPKKKVKAGNCRMFLAESMDAFLAQRSVCGFLQILAMKTRWKKHQHHTTGLNPYKEFQELFSRLKRISDKGFDGDYSKFDKKIPVWAWEILEDVLVTVAGQCEFGKRMGFENTIRQFVRSLRVKLYVFEGNIYLSDGDQASGVFPTNIGDSWLNDVMVIVAVVFTIVENESKPECKVLMKAGTVSANALAEKLDWLTHGDDIGFSVHEDLQAIFNFETYRAFLAPHGVKLTLPSKGDGSATLIPIEDMSFIGRTFEFDGDSPRAHGRLRRTAISRMLHWTRDGTWEAMEENIEAAAREMRAYTAEEYDEIKYDVETVMHDVGRPFMFLPHHRARLDLINERDEIDPVALALAPRLHGDSGESITCLDDEIQLCEVEGQTLSTGSGLQERNDLHLTLRGRSEETYVEYQDDIVIHLNSLRQGPVEAGTTLKQGAQYQFDTNARILEPAVDNSQGLMTIMSEDDSPAERSTRPSAKHDLGPAESTGRKPEPKPKMDKLSQNKIANQTNQTQNNETEKETEPQDRPSASCDEHTGLSKTENRYPCDHCGQVFTHTHVRVINSAAESKKYLQLCEKCDNTNWKVDPIYQELADRIKLDAGEMHILEKSWPNFSPLMNLPHPDKPGELLRASVAKAHTMYHGKPPASIPEALYAPLQCGACEAHVNGAIALFKHAANSHPHLPAINYWPIPPMELQCGEQQFKLHGATAIRVAKHKARTVIATKESATTAGDSLSTVTGGMDPIAGAAANLQEQTNAMEATAGLQVAMATPGFVSGTALPVESAVSLVGPAIPPTLGASTGAQMSAYDTDRVAYEIIQDSQIQASTSLTGTQVAAVSWGDFGPNMTKRLQENEFFSGSTEVQVQFYGTTNTAGSLLVYQVDDENDKYENISDMLRRPNYLISASAGTTSIAMILHQADSILKSRRTNAMKDGMVPQIRLVVYSPLINTYGTDVQVNLKVLTRPGPDYRNWFPKPPGNQNYQITTQVMPFRQFIVFDLARGNAPLKKTTNTLDSQIGYKSYQRGEQELPNAPTLNGMYDEDNRQQFTGVVNPLMRSYNTEAAQDFTEFGGSLSSDVGYKTDLNPQIANDVILKSIGDIFNYGPAGSFNLVHADPDGGFAGLVDSSDYEKATAGVCFESRSLVTHNFETYTFATNADRDTTVKNAIWRDRTRTATSGFSTSTKTNISASMGSMVAKNRSPALVADDLQAFRINNWEDDEWYTPLVQMHDDWGDSSWILRIGQTNYGRVGLYKEDSNVFLYANVTYANINTNGAQIMFHSPQKWNVNNALEFDKTKVTTLLTQVNQKMRDHRRWLSEHKPEWMPYRIRTGTSKVDLMCAYIEAAMIAGGLLEGFGGALKQSRQNAWWDKEFEKSRGHEMAMLNAKMSYGREQDAKHKAYDQKNRSLEMAQQGTSAGLNHHTGAIPNPEVSSNSLNATELDVGTSVAASPSSGTGPTPNGPDQPVQIVPGTTTPKSETMGENNQTPQMYHPSNMMQSSGDNLANPTTASNAINPMTESTKRVSNA